MVKSGEYICSRKVRGYSLPFAVSLLILYPDAKRTYLRRKYTTTKKVHFTEGWIEFKDKKVARSVAEMLNAQPIGGKKGTRWRDDVWTMKYLPKFKWSMLTEQIGECCMSLVMKCAELVAHSPRSCCARRPTPCRAIAVEARTAGVPQECGTCPCAGQTCTTQTSKGWRGRGRVACAGYEGFEAGKARYWKVRPTGQQEKKGGPRHGGRRDPATAAQERIRQYFLRIVDSLSGMYVA